MPPILGDSELLILHAKQRTKRKPRTRCRGLKGPKRGKPRGEPLDIADNILKRETRKKKPRGKTFRSQRFLLALQFCIPRAARNHGWARSDKSYPIEPERRRICQSG